MRSGMAEEWDDGGVGWPRSGMAEEWDDREVG